MNSYRENNLAVRSSYQQLELEPPVGFEYATTGEEP